MYLTDFLPFSLSAHSVPYSVVSSSGEVAITITGKIVRILCADSSRVECVYNLGRHALMRNGTTPEH